MRTSDSPEIFGSPVYVRCVSRDVFVCETTGRSVLGRLMVGA